MMSFRSLARYAPRSLNRLAATGLRQPIVRPSALAKLSQGTILRPRQTSAFSTTMFRRAAAGDEELSEMLKTELEFETGQAEDEQVSTTIKDFLENSLFELHDVPGSEEVKLIRSFGDEKITVSFSISDLTDFAPEMYDEDHALEDEGELDDPIRSPDSKPRDLEAAAEEEEDYMAGAAPPCRLAITIEKPGKAPGALSIDATVREGAIGIDNVQFFDDVSHAHAHSADLSHARMDKYPGPTFSDLEEQLQATIERYLEERGITQALAAFVPEYMEHKDQNEYVRWLEKVKNFVDA